MTTITTPRSAHPGVLYRLGIDTRYLLLRFPAGVASFVVTDPRRLRETAHGLLRFPVAVGISA